MARVCVVGNATKDVNQAGLLASRRPGGTLLYASLALDRLGHEVHPIGYAPLTAYLAMRRAGLRLDGVRLALRPTKFKNAYRDGRREQRARPGPASALDDETRLEGYDAALLGPVLHELPPGVQPPGDTLTLLDLQGPVRRLDEPDLWGWRGVRSGAPAHPLPDADVVRGSIEELAAWLGTREPREAATELRDRCGAAGVVTAGPGGAVGHDGEVHRARPDPVDVEDPTGAGDVFDAGLVHGLLDGRGLGGALETACRLASAFLRGPPGVDPERFPAGPDAGPLA